jgi:hypothetical protein
MTVFVHVANRSFALSRTFGGTTAARWLRRLEVSPWLSGMWLAGVAITMWLVSRS